MYYYLMTLNCSWSKAGHRQRNWIWITIYYNVGNSKHKCILCLNKM